MDKLRLFNIRRLSIPTIAFLAMTAVTFFAINLRAQESEQDYDPYYTVSSSDASGFTVTIRPKLTQSVVHSADPSRAAFNRICMSAGILQDMTEGVPAIEYLTLPFLTPSGATPTARIIDIKAVESFGNRIAPVPQVSRKDGQIIERFIVDESTYLHSTTFETAEIISRGIYRSAYANELIIRPISYDPSRNMIKQVKELVVRVDYGNAIPSSHSAVSSNDADLLASVFINGNNRSLHSAAEGQLRSKFGATSAFKKSSRILANEKWVSVKTTEEGVYRISAAQLAAMGIADADPATINLFGFGGGMLPESPDSTSGELQEVALDVRTDGSGRISEIRFYAPGLVEWRFNREFGNNLLYFLYHTLNPYSTSGNFILRAGGTQPGKRVSFAPDEIASATEHRNTVFTAAVYEQPKVFEVPNISREFIGEPIPQGRDLTISLPSIPGYGLDSAILRPAVSSRAFEAHTFDVKVNGAPIGTITGATTTRDGDYAARSWGITSMRLTSEFGTPRDVNFVVNSNEKSPYYWLKFVEVLYERKTDLAEGAVPFMIFADENAYSYSFTGTSSGEVWDITNPRTAVRKAVVSGSSIDVSLQGNGDVLRRFIAYNDASLREPVLTAAPTPTLRTGIAQTGATNIIITPEAFLEQAKLLAALREKGGQATEPMSSAVVTLEDIYSEFGYGARDVSAIRDFLAYAIRHTTANGATVPMFATLFGGGHADYRNITTQLPVLFPIYETNNFGSVTLYRRDPPASIPDDAFFGRFLNGSHLMGIAIGRIPVLSTDEASNYIGKVTKYETSSDLGDWRGRTTFLIDDRYYTHNDDDDPLPHINDSEREIREMHKQTNRPLVQKLYSQVYPATFTAGGARRKPELENAIIDAFNKGTAIFSFVGHGNPSVWTNESILSVPSTINKLTNFNRLTFLTTATCDFAAFDNYAEPTSGGVMMITKPDGGAIASLSTSRSVYADEILVFEFYNKLFAVGCEEGQGTNHIGLAYIAGRAIAGWSVNASMFLILGDPSQRILMPRKYVVIDSINGLPYSANAIDTMSLASLSEVRLSGRITDDCSGTITDDTFDGTTTVTLYDAPTRVEHTSTFISQGPIVDRWWVDGPILYRGSATVKNGRFTTRFIVPKDIKFDSNKAKLHLYASSDNFTTAMGVADNIRVFGVDSTRPVDNIGPELTIFIGSRRFRSGDIVPRNSKVIIDVKDVSGLNTSTASIGHSFIGWTSDPSTTTIDFAPTYVSAQDDYTTGTSEQQTFLPMGTHQLYVRVFDSQNNPTMGSVEFTARDADPYELYDVVVIPNPARTMTKFTFQHPSAPESPVDAELSIYTTDGRLLRTIEANGISTNYVEIVWDLRDNANIPIPDAAYTYRLTVRERFTNAETTRGGIVIVQKQ